MLECARRAVHPARDFRLGWVDGMWLSRQSVAISRLRGRPLLLLPVYGCRSKPCCGLRHRLGHAEAEFSDDSWVGRSGRWKLYWPCADLLPVLVLVAMAWEISGPVWTGSRCRHCRPTGRGAGPALGGPGGHSPGPDVLGPPWRWRGPVLL